jgi:membrane peptidoglycan carboxypeptidase
VFAADVMADTTYAMTQVLDNPAGTAAGHQLSGRPAAGKTGTNGLVSGNFDAWFIGFTPQLSTAVWFGNADKQREVTENGAPMYGGMLPAQTWQDMMNAALAGKPVESFPPRANVGHTVNSAPPTTATSSASSTSSASPSKSASPTPSSTPLTLSPQPSPTTSPSTRPSSTRQATAGTAAPSPSG